MINDEIHKLHPDWFQISSMRELPKPIYGVRYEFKRSMNNDAGIAAIAIVAFEKYEYTIRVRNGFKFLAESPTSVQNIVETLYQKGKLKEEVLKLYLDSLL